MMGVKSRYSKPSTGVLRRGAVAISSFVAPGAKGGVRLFRGMERMPKDRPFLFVPAFSLKLLAPIEMPSLHPAIILRLPGKKPQP